MALELRTSAEIITDNFGQKSVIACRDIAAGEILAENLNSPYTDPALSWPIMTFEEASCLPSEKRELFMKFAVSIDLEGRIAGPLSIEALEEMSNWINHSCDPNCWWGLEGDTFEARRNIKAGEELTHDYGMTIINVDTQGGWKCLCGSKICRGRLRPDDWKKLIDLDVNGLHFPCYMRPLMQLELNKRRNMQNLDF